MYTGLSALNFGLNLHFPYALEIRPSYLDNEEALAEAGYVYLENIKVKYPLAFSAGISWQAMTDFKLAADFDYKPWSSIRVENPVIEKAPSFDMHSFHIGIEYDWRPASWRVPLRAGFYLRPFQIRTEDGGQLRLPVFTLGSSLYLEKFRLDLGLEWMPVDYSLSAYEFDPEYSLSQLSLSGNYLRFVIDFMFSSDYQNQDKKE